MDATAGVFSHEGSLADLPEQFVLGRDPLVPGGWTNRTIGEWRLGHHPTLPCITVSTSEDAEIGVILGYPITEEGRLLRSSDRFLSKRDGRGFRRGLETLGGRFIGILLEGPTPQAVLDPFGTLSAVFAPGPGVLASTPSLIPYGSETRYRASLARRLQLPASNAMYPFSLTPRHGVWRLLPNHALDLTRWESIRVWPEKSLDLTTAWPEAVEALSQVAKTNLRGVSDAYPCYLPLTGGWDSRMLLACSRGLGLDLVTYTLALPDCTASIDLEIARGLAKQAGLDHETVAWVSPLEADLEEWIFRTGGSTGEERGWRAATTLRQLDPGRVNLYGNIGDLTRGLYCYWQEDDRPETIVTPERLVEGRLWSGSPVCLDEVARWLAGLTDLTSFQVLDLFYAEQRMGGWGGIWPYAEFRGPGFAFFPFCHKEVLRGLMSLAPERRSLDEVPRALIQEEWPELLRWPVNQLPFVRRARRAGSVRARRLTTNVLNAASRAFRSGLRTESPPSG